MKLRIEKIVTKICNYFILKDIQKSGEINTLIYNYIKCENNFCNFLPRDKERERETCRKSQKWIFEGLCDSFGDFEKLLLLSAQFFTGLSLRQIQLPFFRSSLFRARAFCLRRHVVLYSLFGEWVKEEKVKEEKVASWFNWNIFNRTSHKCRYAMLIFY